MEDLTDAQKEAAEKWLRVCKGWMTIVSVENDPLCPNEHGVDNDEEYTRRLIRQELRKNTLLLTFPYIQWIKPAAHYGCIFILRQCDYLDFRPETAYKAIQYLTQYLDKVELEEPIQARLVSVACLSLAAKWDISSKRKVIVEVIRGAEPREFRAADYCRGSYTFTALEILDMELKIWRELDYEMGFTTAFHYTHYFAKKFFPDLPQKNVVSRMEQNILEALKLNPDYYSSLVTLRQRSSVVALAAAIHFIEADDLYDLVMTVEDVKSEARELGVKDNPAAILMLLEDLFPL